MGSETQSCRERRSGRTLTRSWCFSRSPRLARSLSLSLFFSFSPPLFLSLFLPNPFCLPLSRFTAPSVFSTHPPPRPPFLPPPPVTQSASSGQVLASVSFGSSERASLARLSQAASVVPPFPPLVPNNPYRRPPSNHPVPPDTLLSPSDERGARQLPRELRDPSSKRRLRLRSISPRDDGDDEDDHDHDHNHDNAVDNDQ